MKTSQHTPPEPAPNVLDREVAARLLFSFLEPSAKLSHVFGVSMKDTASFLEMAHFKSLMERRLSLKRVARVLGVSTRKAAELASRSKNDFFTPEHKHDLDVRIEFALWAQPLSLKKIQNFFEDNDPSEVKRAVERLVDQGRVVLQEQGTPMYTVTQSARSMVGSSDLTRRIGALKNLMEILTDAVYARFVESDEKAFARSVVLRVRAEQLHELVDLYRETIWPALVALDEAAQGDRYAIPIGFVLAWAPQGVVRGVKFADERDGSP